MKMYEEKIKEILLNWHIHWFFCDSDFDRIINELTKVFDEKGDYNENV